MNIRLTLFCALAPASLLIAQSPGSFTATGNLSVARYFHTATLLTTGQVLIAGGTGAASNPRPPESSLSSAELYDPSTGVFTVTGSLSAPRSGHTATLLADGRVLIAGGESQLLGVLSTAELFDPSTGAFTAAGNMTTARANHSATLLNNGLVLIAGGSSDSDGNVLASAELYDPVAGTFTSTGDMAHAKYYAQATLLPNGSVLLDGLEDTDISSAELYDPATGAFRLTGPEGLPATFAASANLLANGKVLETLNVDCDVSDLAALYDPAAGTFTYTSNMTAWRAERTSTFLPDGSVLVAGGGDSALPSPQTYSYLAHSGAELFDPAASAFTALAAHMVVGRSDHTATLLPDGTVLLAGGWDTGAGNTAELYHPTVATPSPVLLSLSGNGQGAGAILHASTQQVVSANNPAVAGEALEIFLTGLAAGSVIPPQVAIGGRMAQVLFFGVAPGYAGLGQVNVQMPAGIAPGSAVSVRLGYISRPSNAVTIAVR